MNNSSVIRNVFGGGDVFSAERLLTMLSWRTGNGSNKELCVPTRKPKHPSKEGKGVDRYWSSLRGRQRIRAPVLEFCHIKLYNERKEDVSMRSVESFCEKAIEMGIEGAKIIDPDSIVTAEWVRMKCQYGCHRFGTNLCCPPRTPTPDMTRKIIDSYQKAILLHQ